MDTRRAQYIYILYVYRRAHGEKSRGVVFLFARGVRPPLGHRGEGCSSARIEDGRKHLRSIYLRYNNMHPLWVSSRRSCVVDGHWSDRLVIRSVLVNAPGPHTPSFEGCSRPANSGAVVKPTRGLFHHFRIIVNT